MVADSMRLKYPGVEAALTNSGGLRAGPRLRAADRRRAAGRDHLGRGVRRPAVRQPDRRSSTLTGAQLTDGVPATASPPSAIRRSPAAPAGSRRSPASRSRSTATALVAGRRRDLEGAERTQRDAHADRPDATRSGSSRTTSCTRWRGRQRRRLPSFLSQGTDVQQPGDDLLQVTIDYITAHSPVGPVVEGRIVGP